MVQSGAAPAVATGSPAAIRLRGVQKRFGNVTAVEHLDLDIYQKELLVLLGPSGSGKTTTMNMLAGLELPTAGDIYFGDELVTRLPAEERDISMVFQTMALYPHLNVRQNIIFPLQIRKTPANVIEERLAATTKMLGIDQLLKRKIHELSGGQRQRVAIAKALLRRPRLFLLDEPFSNLDAELRRQMRAELVKTHREVETTMVFVTHDQEEAMSIADRIAVMDHGKLVQLGTPLEIYYQPVNLWMARFIGSHPINLLACRLVDETRQVQLTEADTLLVTPDSDFYARVRAATGQQHITLGVRPEFIQISNTGATSATVTGEIVMRQMLGTQFLYDLRVQGQEMRVAQPATTIYEVGAQVSLAIDWAKAFVFDKATEQCLVHS